MLRDLHLSLADLHAWFVNVLRLVGLQWISLKAFSASTTPEFGAIIFSSEINPSGNSIPQVNHLKPAMVLIKSNRL
ncbi:hypothetical protein [Cecembia lonarensis]|uniref:Uncharacterized protein n=1 Tax=Cecembia lonarensis (strain CCUG 58316 / KCTC 22772 / LW9) TaxID=1225176 RepID=K1LA82_CECL9|nr:hypothetical protein [Cecembia lonarensis]EKB47273.1 hypothetical protein B879_04130 [Cecembia lonarensis LW9]